VIDRTLVRTYLYAYIGPKAAPGAPDREAIAAVMPAVREQIAVLDKAVAKSGYLVGDRFTFADINLLPILYRVRQAPEGAEALSAATQLARYYDRHAARPSFTRTIPPPGPPGRATANSAPAR
jgi:glutathione S-transferase